MSLIICPICHKVHDIAVAACTNCGYEPRVLTDEQAAEAVVEEVKTDSDSTGG